MKKSILFLALVFLSFTACEEDDCIDSPSNASEGVLIRIHEFDNYTQTLNTFLPYFQDNGWRQNIPQGDWFPDLIDDVSSAYSNLPPWARLSNDLIVILEYQNTETQNKAWGFSWVADEAYAHYITTRADMEAKLGVQEDLLGKALYTHDIGEAFTVGESGW